VLTLSLKVDECEPLMLGLKIASKDATTTLQTTLAHAMAMFPLGHFLPDRRQGFPSQKHIFSLCSKYLSGAKWDDSTGFRDTIDC